MPTVLQRAAARVRQVGGATARLARNLNPVGIMARAAARSAGSGGGGG